MKLRALGLALLLVCALAENLCSQASPEALAELPPDARTLPPAKKLDAALWNAELHIAVRPGAAPYLVARVSGPGGRGPGGRAGADGTSPGGDPLVEAEIDGSWLRLRRASAAHGERLRVELVLGATRAVKITGGELAVALTGPRRGRPKIDLDLEDSDAELSAVAGGALVGRDAIFRTQQSAGKLTVQLDGGSAEIQRHRGTLTLEGQQSAFELRDVAPRVEAEIDGGRLEVSESQGRLNGLALPGSTFLLSDWSGEVELEATGAALEMRNFRHGSQALKVDAKQTDLLLEAASEVLLELELTGGELRLRDVERLDGRITTSVEAEVEIARVGGSWRGTFQDSEVRLDTLDNLDAEVYFTDLEVDGARVLQLTAHNSQVRAMEVEQIKGLNLVASKAELALAQGAQAEVMVQGISEATIRLGSPCFVLVEDMVEPGPGLDVAGCRVGVEPDAADEDGSVLRGLVGGGSMLEVRESF